MPKSPALFGVSPLILAYLSPIFNCLQTGYGKIQEKFLRRTQAISTSEQSTSVTGIT